jgi:hypothetical protein
MHHLLMLAHALSIVETHLLIYSGQVKKLKNLIVYLITKRVNGEIFLAVATTFVLMCG